MRLRHCAPFYQQRTPKKTSLKFLLPSTAVLIVREPQLLVLRVTVRGWMTISVHFYASALLRNMSPFKMCLRHRTPFHISIAPLKKRHFNFYHQTELYRTCAKKNRTEPAKKIRTEHSQIFQNDVLYRQNDDFSIFYRHRSASRVMKMERYGSVTGAWHPKLSMMFLKKRVQKS